MGIKTSIPVGAKPLSSSLENKYLNPFSKLIGRINEIELKETTEKAIKILKRVLNMLELLYLYWRLLRGKKVR